jgi:hypothetical protein
MSCALRNPVGHGVGLGSSHFTAHWRAKQPLCFAARDPCGRARMHARMHVRTSHTTRAHARRAATHVLLHGLHELAHTHTHTDTHTHAHTHTHTHTHARTQSRGGCAQGQRAKGRAAVDGQPPRLAAAQHTLGAPDGTPPHAQAIQGLHATPAHRHTGTPPTALHCTSAARTPSSAQGLCWLAAQVIHPLARVRGGVRANTHRHVCQPHDVNHTPAYAPGPQARPNQGAACAGCGKQTSRQPRAAALPPPTAKHSCWQPRMLALARAPATARHVVWACARR